MSLSKAADTIPLHPIEQPVDEQISRPPPYRRRIRSHALRQSLKQAKGSWGRKVSTLNTVTIVLAYLSVPFAVAFLCFLWSNPGGDHGSGIWVEIVLSDWTLKSITITTLVLRTAVSAQAAISTSMLASIILEHHGVTLHAAAPLSAIRFVNNGPLSLLISLQSMYSQARFWTWIVVIFFSTTLLLQFMSTVLVADIGVGSVAAPEQPHDTLVGLSFANRNLTTIRGINDMPCWIQSTPNFPLFAEHHEKDDMASDSITDTGLTHRAFLPLVNATLRTSIKSFSGTATVLDSRVACVRPKQHAGLGIAFTEDEGWTLNGTLTPDGTPAGLILPDEAAMTQDLHVKVFSVDGADVDDPTTVDMSWAIQIPFTHDEGEWNIIQKLAYFGPGLVSSLDPRYSDIVSQDPSNFTMSNPDNLAYGLNYYQPGDNIPLMVGRSYVVINMTSAANVGDLQTPDGPSNFYFSADQDLNELVITPRDEWLVFTIKRHPGWHVSASLCFDSFTSVDANISAIAETVTAEPELSTWNRTTQLFGTEYVRQQLGVLDTKTSHGLDTERAVMDLQTKPKQLRDQVQVWYDKSKDHGWRNISFPAQNFVRPDLRPLYSFGTIACSGCGIGWVDSDTSLITYHYINLRQQQILQDVLRTTGNSALAWQAYFTLIGRMAYYDMLSLFDVGDEAVVSWFRTTQFPRTAWGLITVMILLGIHYALATFITLQFVTKTKVSRIGDNAWQCITQVNYSEADEEFRSLTWMKDGEVKRAFDAEDLNDGDIHLGIVEDDAVERVGLRKRSGLLLDGENDGTTNEV